MAKAVKQEAPKPNPENAAIDHVVTEIQLLATECNAERKKGGNYYNVAAELQGQVANLYKILKID